MSETPPSNENTGSAGEPASPKTGPLVGGIVLGVIGTWVVTAVMMLVVLDTLSGVSGWQESVLAYATFWLLPLVAVALLVPRRTRRWGAGLLIGFAIGSILGAGVCMGLVGGTGGL